jgi:hypothetical protein
MDNLLIFQIMQCHTSGEVLVALSLKNRGIPGVPWFIMISCGVTPCHYRPPLPPHLHERTLSTRYWMRQPHGSHHKASQNSISITGFFTVHHFSEQHINISMFHHSFESAYSLVFLDVRGGGRKQGNITARKLCTEEIHNFGFSSC